MTVEETIETYIREDLMHRGPGAPVVLNPDTMLFREHVLDSFGLLALATFIEDRFALKVEDEDMVPENFGTINAIGTYIRERAAPSKAS